MARLFVTGTGTDVGKTIVTTLLTDVLTNEIGDVFPYKPIQTGVSLDEDYANLSDEKVYRFVINNSEQGHCTYYLKHPYSPHLAAKLEHIHINREKLIQQITRIEIEYKGIIIEGAGGLFVPLDECGYSMIQFIKEVNSPIILVADAGLGTINHTVLSILALQSKDIPIIGVILNFAGKNNPLENDNAEMIQKMTGINVIGTVPFKNNIHSYLQSREKRQQLTSNWDIQLIKNTFIQECHNHESR